MYSDSILHSFTFTSYIRLDLQQSISCCNIGADAIQCVCVVGGLHLGASACVCPVRPDVQERPRVVILPVLQALLCQLQAGMLG